MCISLTFILFFFYFLSFFLPLFKRTHGDGFLVCEIPVGKAERILDVEFNNLAHPYWPLPIARATRMYTVPAGVAPHLDFGKCLEI